MSCVYQNRSLGQSKRDHRFPKLRPDQEITKEAGKDYGFRTILTAHFRRAGARDHYAGREFRYGGFCWARHEYAWKLAKRIRKRRLFRCEWHPATSFLCRPATSK